MSPLLLPLSLAEAGVLLILSIVILRLRGRVQHLDAGSTLALVQMQELVQEAQSLSTLLASQLSTQVKLAEQAPQPARKPAPAERPAGVPVAVAAARTATAQRGGLPDPETLDRDAARERGMDPLGLALQRSLHRGAQPAS